jgi:hypothetical protein
MTDNLVPFLREVVGRVITFGSQIQFIHLKELPDGTLLAKASANDGSIHFTSTSRQTIDIGGSRACLGNLGYLNQLLGSSISKAGSGSVEVVVREVNQKLIATAMVFRPNARTEMTYVTTDPFRASITKPKAITIDEWPVMFYWDVEALKEFSEIKRIHAAAPSSGREDIVQISARSESVTVEFGGGASSHATSMVMNVPVVMLDPSQTFLISLNSDQLLRGLIQSQDEEKTIESRLAEKAIQFCLDTATARHELTIVHRKTRE